MKKLFVIGVLCAVVACSASLSKGGTGNINYPSHLKTFDDTLRFLYSQPKEKWPAPFIDSGIIWKELGIIPESPLQPGYEKLRDKIELGKILFFDTRLSSSGKISCASCHMPELSWADGREKSIGHEGQLNKRNSPTILNTWFYKHLFWDGRSNSLEDQAFSPINSQSEMHSSMADAMRTLRRIQAYKPLFEKAFGSPEISPETLTEALAAFERTLVSGKADLDRFLEGDTGALTQPALRGLHLFRTKARCINCHNGPLLTDDAFHNIGLSNYGKKGEDLGRYNVTHKDEDVGKFRTPSLRDVMRTKPWMHNGLHDDMEDIINLYNVGMAQPKPTSLQEKDPMYPRIDGLIKELHLTSKEKEDLIAFLHAVTAPPPKIAIPE